MRARILLQLNRILNLIAHLDWHGVLLPITSDIILIPPFAANLVEVRKNTA